MSVKIDKQTVEKVQITSLKLQLAKAKEVAAKYKAEASWFRTIGNIHLMERDEFLACLSLFHHANMTGSDTDEARRKTARLFEVLDETGTVHSVYNHPPFREILNTCWQNSAKRLSRQANYDGMIIIRHLHCKECDARFTTALPDKMDNFICANCQAVIKW